LLSFAFQTRARTMLHTISWNQFLTVVGLILLGYYAIILLLYYRQELLAFFRGQRFAFSTAQPTSPTAVPNLDSLMGPIKPPDAGSSPESAPLLEPLPFSLLEAEQLVVSVPRNQPSPDALLIGSVADLLEETKTLLAALAEGKGTREECQALLEALFSRYPHLIHTSYPKAINLFVQEQCQALLSFQLTLSEINALWPSN
jgi:hypothetical protein